MRIVGLHKLIVNSYKLSNKYMNNPNFKGLFVVVGNPIIRASIDAVLFLSRRASRVMVYENREEAVNKMRSLHYLSASFF
jgi:hypothetical protein